ncbi:MAG: DUF2202 domain-containing protein [Gammaproteobacteria bacterium]
MLESKILKPISNALIEAINDEYKARATYRHIINKFGEVRPFVNIVEAENRHVTALIPLFEKYGIAVPDDNWDTRIQVPSTILEACQAGVEAEIENAEMYDRLLEATAGYPDIQSVLTQLQRASSENHLPAFQRCVEREGRQGKGQ